MLDLFSIFGVTGLYIVKNISAILYYFGSSLVRKTYIIICIQCKRHALVFGLKHVLNQKRYCDGFGSVRIYVTPNDC